MPVSPAETIPHCCARWGGQLTPSSFRSTAQHLTLYHNQFIMRTVNVLCQSNVFLNGGTKAKFQMDGPEADQGYLLLSSTRRRFKKIRTREAARETICVLWLHKLHQLCRHPYLCTSILASIFENRLTVEALQILTLYKISIHERQAIWSWRLNASGESC